MAKTFTRLMLAVLLSWVGWLGYQYFTKSPTALEIVEKEEEDFFSCDVNALLEKVGKGYEYDMVEKNGKKFWIHKSFRKNEEGLIEMEGRVEFLELLPFTNLRLGHTFKPVLKLRYE